MVGGGGAAAEGGGGVVKWTNSILNTRKVGLGKLR